MVKKIASTVIISIMAIGLFIISPTVTAQSAGCAFLNGSPNSVVPNRYDQWDGTFVFNAGEVITWNFSTTSAIGSSQAIVNQGSKGGTSLLNVTESGSNISSSGSFTIPSTEQLFIVFGVFDNTLANNFSASVSCGDAQEVVSSSDPVEIGPQPAFRDGRINDYDTANPVVIFPIEYGNDTKGLHIYSATGELLLEITPEQLANAPENPDSNLIIATNRGVSFARIRGDGEGFWQVTAPQYNGKTYVLIFSQLFASGGYTSYEE